MPFPRVVYMRKIYEFAGVFFAFNELFLFQAALFNQTEIALILMDHGASLESKNAQGHLEFAFNLSFMNRSVLPLVIK